MERLIAALQDLTEEIAKQNETNQKILMALLDLALGDDDDSPVRTDMDGNPL